MGERSKDGVFRIDNEVVMTEEDLEGSVLVFRRVQFPFPSQREIEGTWVRIEYETTDTTIPPQVKTLYFKEFFWEGKGGGSEG